MKRVIAFILGCILMLSQGISVFAENTEDLANLNDRNRSKFYKWK